VTQLRTANYVFNPVSFFCGYDGAGQLTSVIADVRNTYGGRHRYLLGPAQQVAAGAGARAVPSSSAAFFVSPFLHGDATYDVRVRRPGRPTAARQDVHMDVDRPDGERVFVAHLVRNAGRAAHRPRAGRGRGALPADEPAGRGADLRRGDVEPRAAHAVPAPGAGASPGRVVTDRAAAL
jgi:hypothetical protein